MSVGCGARVRPMACLYPFCPRAIPAVSATAAVAVKADMAWACATRFQSETTRQREAALTTVRCPDQSMLTIGYGIALQSKRTPCAPYEPAPRPRTAS